MKITKWQNLHKSSCYELTSQGSKHRHTHTHTRSKMKTTHQLNMRMSSAECSSIRQFLSDFYFPGPKKNCEHRDVFSRYRSFFFNSLHPKISLCVRHCPSTINDAKVPCCLAQRPEVGDDIQVRESNGRNERQLKCIHSCRFYHVNESN